jgi:hypothetical protein
VVLVASSIDLHSLALYARASCFFFGTVGLIASAWKWPELDHDHVPIYVFHSCSV